MIRDYYHLPQDMNLVLYVPTWRENRKLNACLLYTSIYHKFYKFLFILFHPFILLCYVRVL